MDEKCFKLLKSYEKENYRLRCYYDTCIKLLKYNVNNENDTIIDKKKILIYGCGDIGKAFYEMIKEKCDVLGFLDQSADVNSYKYKGIEVFPIKEMEKLQYNYDFIVITLENLFQVIYEDLITNKVSPNKILSIDEVICN